jgi:Na+-transporting NADH:ubiquinone oxidoreductase subunit F
MTSLPWQQILISIGFLCAIGLTLSILLILAEKKILNYGTCNIDINSGDKIIPVEGGSSLLSSLADNEIFIPSACGGRGTCAYCKVQVKSGGGITGPIEIPYLSKGELEKNVRLSCQVKVRKDLEIAIPEELFSVKKFRAKVTEKKPLTHDIIEFKMELISPAEIEFKAGQYVQLETEKYKGRDSVNRAYSISSIPSDKKNVELMIRKVPEGICTTWVFDHVETGQEVAFSGPYGDFGLTENDAPIIFVAGGSGMAPIWSILRDMKEKGINRKAIYFFGALTEEDLFYTEELKGLEKELADFKYIPALSNEPDKSSWQGERGLVTDVLKRHIPDMARYEAYLCGSPGMIDACVEVMKDSGLPESNIFFDKFA